MSLISESALGARVPGSFTTDDDDDVKSCLGVLPRLDPESE